MAIIGHIDARVLAQDLVDQAEVNAKLESELLVMQNRVGTIEGDYANSKNIGQKFRSSTPIFHSNTNIKVDYDTLPFNDHLIWDYATGETHAPPVAVPQWVFLEMVKTHDYGTDPNGHNALQRAWGYKDGFLAVRARYQGVWSAWKVMSVDTTRSQPDLPAEPEEPTP